MKLVVIFICSTHTTTWIRTAGFWSVPNITRAGKPTSNSALPSKSIIETLCSEPKEIVAPTWKLWDKKHLPKRCCLCYIHAYTTILSLWLKFGHTFYKQMANSVAIIGYDHKHRILYAYGYDKTTINVIMKVLILVVMNLMTLQCRCVSNTVM